MDRSFDKDKPQQEALKHEDRKDRKHEGARENRPERPAAGDEKLAHDKRDEEQDKKIERDEEQPKVAGDEDLEDKDEDLGLDEPKLEGNEAESGNEVKVEPTDDAAPSQGI